MVKLSLDHAILGFLSYGSLSGYELKARFDLSVQHFWPADQSHIYRTLAKLDEQGYTRLEVVQQEVRPDRKVYHITQAGREELRRWLTVPLEMDKGRSASLVQVFFSGQLSNGEILEIFRRAANQCRSGLEELRKVPNQAKPFTEMIGNPREAWCWFLTLECGIRMTEANLAWLEDVIRRIEKGELPPKGEKETAT
jgi:DNA-binding PadR family transcriptional regulator